MEILDSLKTFPKHLCRNILTNFLLMEADRMLLNREGGDLTFLCSTIDYFANDIEHPSRILELLTVGTRPELKNSMELYQTYLVSIRTFNSNFIDLRSAREMTDNFAPKLITLVYETNNFWNFVLDDQNEFSEYMEHNLLDIMFDVLYACQKFMTMNMVPVVHYFNINLLKYRSEREITTLSEEIITFHRNLGFPEFVYFANKSLRWFEKYLDCVTEEILKAETSWAVKVVLCIIRNFLVYYKYTMSNEIYSVDLSIGYLEFIVSEEIIPFYINTVNLIYDTIRASRHVVSIELREKILYHGFLFLVETCNHFDFLNMLNASFRNYLGTN